jgi:hypothetical protein
MILQTMDRFTIIKRLYKEDCIRILKSLSVDDLKRFADIDERDKTNLLRILKIGFKKEDLNFALANLQHIADETFSRFKNHALGENEVVFSIEDEKRDDSAPAPNLGDENDARGEKGANLRRDGFSAERVSHSNSAPAPNLGDKNDDGGEKEANLRRDGKSADGVSDSNLACTPNLGDEIDERGEKEANVRRDGFSADGELDLNLACTQNSDLNSTHDPILYDENDIQTGKTDTLASVGGEIGARGEKEANLRRDGFSAERVSASISACTPNLGDEIDARGGKEANLRRDGFSADGELDSNSACIPNLGGKINVRGEIEVSRHASEITDVFIEDTQYSVEILGDVQDSLIQIQMRDVAEIGTVFDTYVDSMNNQQDDQQRIENRQQRMNEISKLGQTKERFKHNVAELLKTRIEAFNQSKSKYAHQDKEFKFYKENILPMIRMLNLNPADYRMRE